MRAIACVVIFVGCSFSDPKLDDTRFRCEPGGKCPAGQKCAGTLCVVESHDGVACNVPCTPEEQCCDDGVNPRRCIPAGDDCVGDTAFCDEKTDCRSGSRCCDFGGDLACDVEDCFLPACQAASDCPSGMPNCCATTPAKPWKMCQMDPC